ncbi:betsin [Elysia marginata]|uniref:Betsin n=1 Tax=Elysia marginata TaxID=1093978 RepID=A0AAV4HQ98_9GAST|nr:betsin [Elysia marginata]
MECQMFGVMFLAAVCACSVASLPTNSRRQEDIHQLVSLLGKLKNIERVRQQQYYHNSNHHHSKQQQQQHEQLLSGISLSGSRHSPAAVSSSGPEFGAARDNSALNALTSGMRSAPALASPDDTSSLLLGGDDGGLGLDLVDDGAAAEDLLRGRNSGGSAAHSEKSKRQGAWSYDYGLGGGRFGKRSYGDYGIGGGRYGRDVDHVDISDTSDADASTL